jgi:DNA-directed RNA polymerase subunit RPC12/RpoP
MSNEISDIVKDLKFERFDVPSWAKFQPEIAKKDGIEYHRKNGSKIIYKQVKNGYECMNCGSDILVASVAHPIHDGPFPLSGLGKCEYEQVPYCPKCEKKPDFDGSFITVKNSFF